MASPHSVVAPIALAALVPLLGTAGCIRALRDRDGGVIAADGAVDGAVADARRDTSFDATHEEPDADTLPPPSCDPAAAHLVVGSRHTRSGQGTTRVYRFDSSLGPCPTLELAESTTGSILSIGGTSSGAELLGADRGRARLVLGDRTLWNIERDSDNQVAAAFSLVFDGREVGALFWIEDSYERPVELELLSLEDGATVATFNVPSELEHLGPAMQRENDHGAGILESRGAQQYRLDSGADSLASTGETQVAAPQLSGGLNGVIARGDHLYVAADHGVLFWDSSLPPAFLGTVPCRVATGPESEALPVDEDAEYVALTYDRHRTDAVLVIVDGDLDDGRDGTFLYRLTDHGECELLLENEEDQVLTSVAWSGADL